MQIMESYSAMLHAEKSRYPCRGPAAMMDTMERSVGRRKPSQAVGPRDKLRGLAALVRWREWSDSKLPMFMAAAFYAGLLQPQLGIRQLGPMAALFLLLCLYAAFGHLINDYADRELDRAAGKDRPLARWSEPACFVALTLPCLGAAIVAIGCFDRPTIALIVAAFLIAALYSMPPARLKQRGRLGWAAAALAQRTLPVAIVFEAFHAWDVAAFGFTALSTLIGLRFIIVHQLADAANDRRGGIATPATEQGPARLVALLYGLFALEIAVACGTVAAMALTAPLLAIPALAYAVLRILGRIRGRGIEPVSYFVFSDFYHVVWPISLSLLLAARNPLFLLGTGAVVALVQQQIRRIPPPIAR